MPVQKSLTDLFTFQEIIVEHQPTLFVEFGSLNGGSALYVSQIMSMVTVETIDYSLYSHNKLLLLNVVFQYGLTY